MLYVGLLESHIVGLYYTSKIDIKGNADYSLQGLGILKQHNLTTEQPLNHGEPTNVHQMYVIPLEFSFLYNISKFVYINIQTCCYQNISFALDRT